MSLFLPKCCVCNKNAGILATGNKSFNLVCSNCRKKILNGTNYINLSMYTTEECKERVMIYNESNENLNNFIETKSIGENKYFKYLIIDNINKKVALYPKLSGSKILPTIVSYEDIINFELLEDGESIISGGLGEAIVGDILFGGVGAIVGGITAKRKNKNTCNSLFIRISLNNIDTPNYIINFINYSISKSSEMYKTKKEKALECISVLEYICNNKKTINKIENNNNISKADEIKKYKELMDEGALTEEEYNKLKSNIINNTK